MKGEIPESIGELLTQDPYHRHVRLIGVIAIIARHKCYYVSSLKFDETMSGGAIAGIRTRVTGLGSLHHNH